MRKMSALHIKALLSVFRKKTIIYTDKKAEYEYNPNKFLIDCPVFTNERHNTVSSLTIMLNNKCVTNCYYCYADKRNPIDCKITFTRLNEIIEEAHKLNVVSIDVIGGEVFLYKQWKELLDLLVKYNYRPLLSTKMPLKEDDIEFLAVTELPLQVSLDSLLPETLSSLLSVSEAYSRNIGRMFDMLQKYRIKTAVHTVLTQRNTTIKDLHSVYDFLCQYDNILY